jgi:HEAT repeat protein
MKSESALDELLKGTDLTNTKVRTAVATALGQFYHSDRAFEALKMMLEDQESYFVVAAAATSIGKTQHDSALEVLSETLRTAAPSWHYIVQQGYLNGLAETEKEEVIDIIKPYSEVGKPDEIRRIIPGLLARLGKRYKKERPEMKSDLERLLQDNSFRVAVNALRGAKTYGDAALIPVLERIADSEVEGRYVRYAREAIRALSKKKDVTEIDSIRKSVESLEKENKDLKDRLSKVEALLKDKEEQK